MAEADSSFYGPGFIPTGAPPIYPGTPMYRPSNPYYVPCKCDYLNQIRYYNHRSKEFYYHTAAHMDHPPHPPGTAEDVGNLSQAFPPQVYYDTYGPYAPPMGHYPNTYYPPAAHPGYQNLEAGLCELVLVLLALLLWLYSFFRLYRVWQRTLNFNESSIQGPQGWDLLVNWIIERIRIKNLRVPGMNVRGRSKSVRRGAVCDSISDGPPTHEHMAQVEAHIGRSIPTVDDAERGDAGGLHSTAKCSPQFLRAVTKTSYENELNREEISTISSLKQEIDQLTAQVHQGLSNSAESAEATSQPSMVSNEEGQQDPIMPAAQSSASLNVQDEPNKT